MIEAPSSGVLRTEMRPETFASIVNVLVRNSLEWKRDGRPVEMIAIISEVTDGVELQFSDSGRGVIPTLEDKLFEPGVSGHDGSGMGLTIARNLLAAHGGSISLVIDRRRRGAMFRLLFPRKRSRATAPRSP